ncbi:MAG: hypothetical protein ACUVRY_07660 [Thermoanaerobaculaceae bacterium]
MGGALEAVFSSCADFCAAAGLMHKKIAERLFESANFEDLITEFEALTRIFAATRRFLEREALLRS